MYVCYFVICVCIYIYILPASYQELGLSKPIWKKIESNSMPDMNLPKKNGMVTGQVFGSKEVSEVPNALYHARSIWENDGYQALISMILGASTSFAE